MLSARRGDTAIANLTANSGRTYRWKRTRNISGVTFVPPGNVFTDDTLDIAARYGLRVVSCATPPRAHPHLTIVGNEQVLAFHDREIVLDGIGWLRARLDEQHERTFCFVRDLAEWIDMA